MGVFRGFQNTEWNNAFSAEVVACTSLHNKPKAYNFSLLAFFFCMCEDEFISEQETSEKEKHDLESNENSPEVSSCSW